MAAGLTVDSYMDNSRCTYVVYFKPNTHPTRNQAVVTTGSVYGRIVQGSFYLASSGSHMFLPVRVTHSLHQCSDITYMKISLARY